MNTFDRRTFVGSSLSFGLLTACSNGQQSADSKDASPETFGEIERYDDRLDQLIDAAAPIAILANGFVWSEGPAWDRTRNCLYFSDVPENVAYRWKEDEGATAFLTPSGIPSADANGFREPGSNGLLWVSEDQLLICNHGKRAIEACNPATKERSEIVSSFDGRRFNSPNDLVRSRAGDLYFTDPPYGLEGLDASPLKEMPENGVYRLSAAGEVSRLLSDMTFPNGVALSPDERTLYVAQSDPSDPYIRRISLGASGEITDDRRWFDAADLLAAGDPGLPDGMAVSGSGHVFATGPGGVLILDPDGTLLGRINLGQATANCAFGEDGRTLFITSGDKLLKVRTRTRGLSWAA